MPWDVKQTAWVYVCIAMWIMTAVRAWTISRDAPHPFMLPRVDRFIPCCLGTYELAECTFPDMSAAAPVNASTSCPWGCRRYDVTCDSLGAVIPVVPPPLPRPVEIAGAVAACVAVSGAVISGTWLAVIMLATLVGKRDAVDTCHDRLMNLFRYR